MKKIKVVDNTNIVNLDTINSTSLNFILDKDQVVPASVDLITNPDPHST